MEFDLGQSTEYFLTKSCFLYCFLLCIFSAMSVTYLNSAFPCSFFSTPDYYKYKKIKLHNIKLLLSLFLLYIQFLYNDIRLWSYYIYWIILSCYWLTANFFLLFYVNYRLSPKMPHFRFFQKLLTNFGTIKNSKYTYLLNVLFNS